MTEQQRVSDQPCVRVRIEAIKGSAPREIGASMLVMSDGIAGSIGGGNLEYQAIQRARSILEAGPPFEPTTERVGLGPALNQCCGGSVTLLFEYAARAPDAWLTKMESTSVPLFIFGAGHVGKALVRLIGDLPFDVTWIDAREDAWPERLPDNVTALHSTEPARVAAEAPANCFHVVMTHSHELDEDICHAVLAADRSAWLGLIGSETKLLRFRHRLAARGISADRLERIECPIGLAGVRGKRPATIAVAIAAQLMSLAPPEIC